MIHDALCPPGMKAGDELCPWCVLIRKARADERRKVLAVADALRGLLEMPLDTSPMSDPQHTVAT